MMLQTVNWMISYLLKAELVKLVETDVLEKKLNFLIPFTRTKILVNWYSPLLCSLKTQVQTQIQSIKYNHANKQNRKHTVNMQTINTTSKYIQDNITNRLMYMDNLKR